MALLKKWSIRAGATRIAALLRKRRLDTQLDAELHLHLEMLVEENIRNGMTPEQARLAALRTFGGVDQTKEAYREQRGIPVLDSLIQDVRYGIRQLARNPGFAAITIFTLALGIGANTAVFTLTNALLLRSLPVPKPDELVRYHMLAEPIASGHAEAPQAIDVARRQSGEHLRATGLRVHRMRSGTITVRDQ